MYKFLLGVLLFYLCGALFDVAHASSGKTVRIVDAWMTNRPPPGSRAMEGADIDTVTLDCLIVEDNVPFKFKLEWIDLDRLNENIMEFSIFDRNGVEMEQTISLFRDEQLPIAITNPNRDTEATNEFYNFLQEEGIRTLESQKDEYILDRSLTLKLGYSTQGRYYIGQISVGPEDLDGVSYAFRSKSSINLEFPLRLFNRRR